MFKQKKLSRGARFALSVASFFLGLLLFFSAIATALIADVNIVLSKDGISGILRTMISAPAHVRPKAPITIAGEGGLRVAPRIQRAYQIPRREEPGDMASSLTDQIIGMFYQEMGNMFGEEMTFTQEEFVEMVSDSTVMDYIVDKTASLITDYFNDEITTTFEPEEVVQLIQENSALIESITGAPIPDDIAEQVSMVFDENEIVALVEKEGLAGFLKLANGYDPENPKGSDNISSSDGILPFNPREIIDPIQQVCSTTNLIIGIAVCVALMAAIILINCRQLGKGLRRAGYPLLFAGSMIVLNILAKFQPDMWVVVAGEGETVSPAANLVLKVGRHILLQTAVVNIVVFGAGVVLVIGGIVLSIVLRIKGKAVVTVPTTAETEELAAAIVDETPVEILPEAKTQEAPVAEESEDTPAPIGE